MYEEQEDPVLRRHEKQFQKMLVNNMESVFKIFFRGMSTIRVSSDNIGNEDGFSDKNFSLKSLEAQKIV